MADGGAEPPWLSTASAHLRLLQSEESDGAASAWIGATIAMVAMLIAGGGIGGAAFFWLRHRALHAQNGQPVQRTITVGKQAWPDIETGGEVGDTTLNGSTHPEAPTPDKVAESVRLELIEALRGVLEDASMEKEISHGLNRIRDRLDRLEQQSKEQQVLSGSLLPPTNGCSPKEEKKHDDLDSTANTLKREAWHVEAKGCSPTLEQREANGNDAKIVTDSQLPSLRHVETRDASTLVEERELEFRFLSPSARQKRFPDPPEKGWMKVDEDRSLKGSLATVSRNLAKRDSQTQELHRQLRETQADCVNQKLEASYNKKRLQDLLSDPQHAPAVQAKELSDLRKKVDDLSARLADTKSSEMQWCIIAKRQRAFFMQSEHLTTEQVNLFRKHPAGELFLAPPPVYLEDDLEESFDSRRTPWDVGSQHINPYATDSWPFEPNACAQRCAAEPNLNRWEEEDGIDSDHNTDSEDDLANYGVVNADDVEGDSERHLHLRLPMLPPQSPHEEDYEPPEPPGPPEPLPQLSTSARSY